MTRTKFITLCMLSIVGLFSSLAGYAKSTRAADFALLDQQGTYHQLSYYGDQEAVVLYIHGTQGGLVKQDLPALQRVQQQFAEDDVVFFMLNPALSDSRQSVAAHAEKLAINMPVLIDESQLVAESLGVQRQGELLVIDPQSMTLAYRGTPNGQISSVIEGLINNAEVTQVVESSSDGAAIVYQSQQQHSQHPISYSKGHCAYFAR